MKRIYKYQIFIITLFMGLFSSCNEEFLKENPPSFLSTTNAFVNAKDFDASINNLYNLVRREYFTVNDYRPFHYQYRTDLCVEVTASTSADLNTEFGPDGVLTGNHWNSLWKIVSEANTVLSRIPNSSMSDADKVLFEAKGKFFRGFGYRTIAYLYGGVPLILEEITTPKTDFVRATKKEVLTQVIADLTFAAENLPKIANVRDGEISDLVAQHVLAEVYIADGQFQKAVDAATVAINDPATDLMRTRFGKRSTVTPGDVYWDLFQVGNQNRKSGGNREALWVIQLETDVIGGGASTTGGSQENVFALERVHAPLYRDMRIGGVALFQWPIGDYTGGRGVGFLQPSLHYENVIWQSDFNNDIRNANHNFVREVTATNPASPLFGQTISTLNPPVGYNRTFPTREFYPYQSKATTPFNHPTALYVNPGSTDPIKKYEVKSGAGGTYCDQYMIRLAETYLIRAEAYLGLERPDMAAVDINIVRSRSNASDVAAANVNIDYILDERLREFGVEEKRMITLMRMGKLVDRVSRFNPFYGTRMQSHFNLWAIPRGEIERNRGAAMDNNPGYN